MKSVDHAESDVRVDTACDKSFFGWNIINLFYLLLYLFFDIFEQKQKPNTKI
jgi:hypothetical protein